MPTTAKTGRTRRINIRATSQDESLIRQGAKQRGVNLSSFVLESARLHAEQVLADKRDFALDPRQWRQFLDLLDRPPRPKPRLRRLLREPGLLDR